MMEVCPQGAQLPARQGPVHGSVADASGVADAVKKSCKRLHSQ